LHSGCGACVIRVGEVPGSNPGAPTQKTQQMRKCWVFCLATAVPLGSEWAARLNPRIWTGRLAGPRQRSFEPGHQARYPASYPERPAEGPAITSRFPAAFRPPAFASRSSHTRQGIGSPHGRPTDPHGPDPDGVTAFRTHELRPGWVPRVPRGRRCSSRTEARSQPASAAPPRLVPKPRHNIPPCEAPLHEASNRGSSRSPVRSSPRPRHRDGTSDASASP
jgi:hypothetical protein